MKIMANLVFILTVTYLKAAYTSLLQPLINKYLYEEWHILPYKEYESLGSLTLTRHYSFTEFPKLTASCQIFPLHGTVVH